MSKLLTPEQIQHYQRRGYIASIRVISDERAQQCGSAWKSSSASRASLSMARLGIRAICFLVGSMISSGRRESLMRSKTYTDLICFAGLPISRSEEHTSELQSRQ